MLKPLTTTSALLFLMSAQVSAFDSIVPPPPVPNAPAVVVPHSNVGPSSIPLSSPATIADPTLPSPYLPVSPAPSMAPVPTTAPTAVPATVPAVVPGPVPATVPSVPDATYSPGIPSTPIEDSGVISGQVWSGNTGTYLFQPAPGTIPYSQSQYNTFSTTGIPIGPQSYSPNTGIHDRYPYYSYRRPWYTPGRPSQNVNIIW